MSLYLIPIWLWLAGIPVVWVYGAYRAPLWYREKELAKYGDEYRHNARIRKPSAEVLINASVCVFLLGLFWVIAAPFAYGIRRGMRKVAEIERVVLLEAKADELARTVGLNSTDSSKELERRDFRHDPYSK